jgi:hypothetical protein
LLGNDQLVELGGTVLVIPLVPEHRRETLFNELFRDVAPRVSPFSSATRLAHVFWLP